MLYYISARKIPGLRHFFFLLLVGITSCKSQLDHKTQVHTLYFSLSFSHTHSRARTHIHTHAHPHAHTHAHVHTRTHAHRCLPGGIVVWCSNGEPVAAINSVPVAHAAVHAADPRVFALTVRGWPTMTTKTARGKTDTRGKQGVIARLGIKNHDRVSARHRSG